MKICFLCNEYPPSPHGGIGTFTQVLARSLVQYGHEVRVTGVYPHRHVDAERQVDEGVSIFRLRAPESRFGWPLARYQLWRHISDWTRQGAIDLVEAPDWEGWTGGWPKLSIPVIIRLHGSVSYFQRELDRPVKPSIFRLERSAMRRANAWCSVSRYTAEKTKAIFGIESGPDAILYNPVESSPVEHIGVRRNQQVIFTGTLTYKKGIVSLIRAWPKVRQACPDAQLQIYGKNARADNGQSMTQYLTEQMSNDGSCHFHGHVSRQRLFEVLGTARVAVFPSYAEAFAVAPLESMTQGCPTIYSRRGSGPELIDDGIHGLLIDPDQSDQIADAIIRLLQDDELSSRLSSAGRRRVEENFSLARLTEQNIAFYKACVDGFRAKAA